MNMVDAVKSVLSQYVGFRGRARRSEYWYWTLATILVSFAVEVFEGLIGTSAGGTGLISLLFSLAIFLPGLAVSFRRVHDIGRSGWWVGGFYLIILLFFVVLIAAAGGLIATDSESEMALASLGVFSIVFGLGIVIFAIILLVFFCTDSQVGPNRYGPNPKHEGNYDVFE
ncbi:MAG: DUF805 domain-containing protein [Litorimonas sp.]